MAIWSLIYDEWDLKEELLRESLCTLGNGYFATRGAAEESSANEHHYPGTYLGGGYNRIKSEVYGRIIENEDLVNWPNWLSLTFRIPGKEWFQLEKVKIISYQQELNLKEGILERSILFQDEDGRESCLQTTRFVSMNNPHLAGIRWNFTPLNWSGDIEFKSLLDGQVSNKGVARYRALNGDHLCINSEEILAGGEVLLEAQTTQSEILMSIASSLSFKAGDNSEVCTPYAEARRVGHLLSCHVKEGENFVLDKIVALFTSRDRAVAHPSYEASKLLKRNQSFDSVLNLHKKEWNRLWALCDISLPQNPRETKLLRLHVFHLLQTVSENSIDRDVGVPSRGLHGEAYRGHIFWDEIYIFPFLNMRMPEITRSLLLYRYHRLNEARANAQVEGLQGAMYPWQSGSDGEEESQILHLNPESGRWVSDNTFKQRHINSTIFYNIWNYYQTTHDHEFLYSYGIEMALEISKFWVSKSHYNQTRDKYEIHGVVGPDEFHTKYPDRDELGINNNAYTNFMASWTIRKTLELLKRLPGDKQSEVVNMLGLCQEDFSHWEHISKNFYIPILKDDIIEQFEGFDNLQDLDWKHYEKKYGNIQRIDRILESEGDTANKYKLNKQSDVLMLYYLFSAEELEEGFQWLGYPFHIESIEKNINYHLNLSSNGSTLSRVVHSWVLSRHDRKKSWHWFGRALESDVSDIQGGTTVEGIHLGAMAGTVDLVQRCYTGIRVDKDTLWFNPKLPEEVPELNLRVRFRGHTLRVEIKEDVLHICVEESWAPSGLLGFKNKVYEFGQGDKFSFPLKKESHEGPRLTGHQ